MKKILLLLAIASIFLAGCKSSNPVYAGNPTTTIQQAVETTITVENCPKQFLRQEIKADGSIEKYCLPPSYFRLNPCNTDADCSTIEECRDGYCYILYEDDV